MGEAEDRAARAARARNLLRRAQEKRQQQQQQQTPLSVSESVPTAKAEVERRNVPEVPSASSTQEEELERRMNSFQQSMDRQLQNVRDAFEGRLAILLQESNAERGATQNRITELGAEVRQLREQVGALQTKMESYNKTKTNAMPTASASAIHAEILQGIPDARQESIQGHNRPQHKAHDGEWAVSQSASRQDEYASRYTPLSTVSQDYVSRYAPPASTASNVAPKQSEEESTANTLYQTALEEEARSQQMVTQAEASPVQEPFDEEDVFKAGEDNDALMFSGEDEMAPIKEEEEREVEHTDIHPPATDSKRESLANDIGELFGSSTNFADDDPFGKIGRNDSHDFSAAFSVVGPTISAATSVSRKQPQVKVEEKESTASSIDKLFQQPTHIIKSPTVSTNGTQKMLNVAPLASPFTPVAGPRESGARELLSPNSFGASKIEDAFGSTTPKVTDASASRSNHAAASNEDVSDLFRTSTSADFFGSRKPVQQQTRPAVVPPPPRTPQRTGLPMMSFTAPAQVEEDDKAAAVRPPLADTSTDATDASILFGASPPKPTVGGGSRSRGGHHRRAITNANFDFLSSPMRPGASYGGQAATSATSNASDDGSEAHSVPAARKSQLLDGESSGAGQEAPHAGRSDDRDVGRVAVRRLTGVEYM